MEIIDLTPEHEQLYFVCLEDWSEEMKEAGDHKAQWFGRMKDQGLRVKLALDDAGTVGGMIQYIPAELFLEQGQGFYYILCIWVHGYKEGRGNFRKQGMGRALLQAAEEDAKALGARGLAAWGVSLPVFMRASWFKKRGYKVADKMGVQVLLWKAFDPDVRPPKWVRQQKKPEPVSGKVSVTSFMTGWCPAQNLVCERARRAAEELGDTVVFACHNTSDQEVYREWGIGDALYVDGRLVRTGPPPSYEKIRKIIAKKVKKLRT